MSNQTEVKITIISRHQSTIEHLKFDAQEAGFEIKVISSINEEIISKMKNGDIVYGNIPLKFILLLCEKGIKYFAIEFAKHPPRGTELTEKELIQYGIHLKEYLVFSPEVFLKLTKKEENDDGIILRGKSEKKRFPQNFYGNIVD